MQQTIKKAASIDRSSKEFTPQQVLILHLERDVAKLISLIDKMSPEMPNLDNLITQLENLTQGKKIDVKMTRGQLKSLSTVSVLKMLFGKDLTIMLKLKIILKLCIQQTHTHVSLQAD